MTLKLTFVPLTDVGRERSQNQDAFGNQHLDALDFYIVCDGMGGHRGGEAASQLGVQVLQEQLAERTDLAPAERIEAALVAANEAIFRQANVDPDLRGMGTTAVVLAIDSTTGTAHYAHVGDSRIYLVRDNTIRQLTRDHTFVQRLVDDGILTEEAAESHPQSNVIIRSLGGQNQVDVEIGDTPITPQEGDIFVLCSDGLHGLVKEPEIAATLHELPIEDAAARLISMANERGGHDNITVELILVGQRGDAPDTWTVIRPTPAPGTRLALKAQEELEAEAQTGTSVTQPIPAPTTEPPEEPTSKITSVTAYQPSSSLNTAVLVTVVLAIVLCAIMLFALFRSSPAAVTTLPPAGTLPTEGSGN